MELKDQMEAYTEETEEIGAAVKTPEETEKERQFWLDVKYSDEHWESER